MSISEYLPPPSTQRVFRPDPTAVALREEHHRATFSAVRRPGDAGVLVTVHGEVDATNAPALARFVERRVPGARRVVVDLQTVEFFGGAGFAALTNMSLVCARAGVSWLLLAGPQVWRVLQVCDPERELPVAAPCPKYFRARPRDRQFLVGGHHEHRGAGAVG